MQDRRLNSASSTLLLARRRRLPGPVYFVLGLCLLHVLAAGWYRHQAISQNPVCNQYLLAADLTPIIGPESSHESVAFTFASPAPSGDIPLEIVSDDSEDAPFIEAPGQCSVKPEQSAAAVRVKQHPQTPSRIELRVRSSDPRARFQNKKTPQVAPQSELMLTTLLAKASTPPQPKPPTVTPRDLNPIPVPPTPLPPPRLPAVRMTGPVEPIRGDLAAVTIFAENLTTETLQVELLPPGGVFRSINPLELTATEPARRVDLQLLAGVDKPLGPFEVRARVTGFNASLEVPPLKLEFFHRQWTNPAATVRLLYVDTEFAPGPLAESIAQIVAEHHSQLADDGVVLIRQGQTVVIRNGDPLGSAGSGAFTGDHWKDAFTAVTAELDTAHQAIVIWPSPMLPTAGAAPLKVLSHLDLIWCNGPDISAPQVNDSIREHVDAWWRNVEVPNLTEINTEMAPERLREEIQKIMARE
jgi:hypothetical protein